MSDSLQPHGLKHARLPCPWPTPRACSSSCPSSQWCHPTISSSVILFSSCLQGYRKEVNKDNIPVGEQLLVNKDSTPAILSSLLYERFFLSTGSFSSVHKNTVTFLIRIKRIFLNYTFFSYFLLPLHWKSSTKLSALSLSNIFSHIHSPAWFSLNLYTSTLLSLFFWWFPGLSILINLVISSYSDRY